MRGPENGKLLWGWMSAAIVLVACLPCVAMPLASPNRFEIAQAPGTTETYTMALVANPEAAGTEEVSLFLTEWKRTATGEHDYGVPVNGARWVWDRAFAAGETLEMRYQATSDAVDLGVEGRFVTGTPQVSGDIAGASRLDGTGEVAPTSGAPTVTIRRTIEAGTVTLRAEFGIAVEGLAIREQYSGGVRLSSIDSAGGAFDTVERSCSSWIALSDSLVQVAPGETRNVTFTVTTPTAYEGSYWSAIYVLQRSQAIVSGMSATINAGVAVKVFVTAPGTEIRAAAITGLAIIEAAPFAWSASVENRGNVELALRGFLDVVDRSGVAVRQIPIDEFKVLPGTVRILTGVDGPDVAALARGDYQARLRLEYGVEGVIVGTRGFRVP